MPRRKTISYLNKQTYLLLDREGNAVAVTPRENLAEEWSEQGHGDYQPLDIVYNRIDLDNRGGVDARTRD